MRRGPFKRTRAAHQTKSKYRSVGDLFATTTTPDVYAGGRRPQERELGPGKAIRTAIDDYAELETGNREYFWNRPHSIGY